MKKTVNRERQTINRREMVDDAIHMNRYKLKTFRTLAERYGEKFGVDAEEVVFTFSPEECYGDHFIEMYASAERMETDAEMEARIRLEEAAVAKDEENARKSKLKQKEQDLNALRRFIENNGEEWVKEQIDAIVNEYNSK